MSEDPDPIGVGQLRIIDEGPNGRIIVSDSLAYCDERITRNDVTVAASFAGLATMVRPLARGTKAVIAHDAGIGKDQAGIGGLPFGDRHGLPVAAVAGLTAALSNGNSLYQGEISHANMLAQHLGVRPGQSVADAAKLLSKAPPGRPIDAMRELDFSMREMKKTPTGSIYVLWSLIKLVGTYPNDVFSLATHSARAAAEHAFQWGVKGWIANDAGMGKSNTGIGGLSICAEKGMPAAAVSTMSARIGDAMSTYQDGLISAANAVAARKGVVVGMSAKEALARMVA